MSAIEGITRISAQTAYRFAKKPYERHKPGMEFEFQLDCRNVLGVRKARMRFLNNPEARALAHAKHLVRSWPQEGAQVRWRLVGQAGWNFWAEGGV